MAGLLGWVEFCFVTFRSVELRFGRLDRDYTQEKHTVWVGTKELLLSKEGREIILLRAEHELRSFVTKYDHLEELTVVEPIKLFLKKRAEERDGDGA